MSTRIERPETNTRRVRALVALLALAAVAAAPSAPSGKATLAVSPRFFPVWQARNVAFPFVLRDSQTGLLRMYYAGSGAAQLGPSAWDQWATGLATSRDGIRWTFPHDYEPVLPAYRFATGEVVEPARRAHFDAMGAFGVCVLRDGPRWLMWYTGWNGDDAVDAAGRAQPVHYRIGLATSPDGVEWTPQPGDAGAGAVLGLGPEGTADSVAAGQPFVVREGGAYRMWYEAFDGRTWRIATARSSDGRAWTRAGVALEPGTAGARDALGTRNPVVVQRRGRWELWYQGRSAASPSFHVLRASSDDGRVFTKLRGEMLPDPPLRDEEALHADSAIVLPGGALRVFFARERTLARRVAWGQARSHSFHIYSAVVDP